MKARYPEYAEKGPAWCRSVPAHWDVLPLMSLGSESRRKNQGLVEQNLLSLSYGCIVSKDINSSEGLLPESFETYQIVEPDDIVFRFTDLQNDKRSLRTARVHERGIITSAYTAFTPHRILPAYFEYVMRAYDLTKVFYGMGGGLRQSLRYEDVRRLPILFPPPPEQRAIADFVDRETAKIDALIAKQNEMIALLRERMETTITHAALRSGSPDIRLSRVTTGLKDGTHGTFVRVDRSEGLPLLSAKNVTEAGLVVGDHESYISHEDHAAIVFNGFPKHGDVLLVIVGATIGKSAVYTLERTAAFQRSVAFLRPGPLIDPRFLYYQTRTRRFQDELSLRSKTSAQPGIYLGDIAAIPVSCPPLHEQRNIVKHLDEATSQVRLLIAKAEEHIALAQERRAALITAAVTGQIDVTGKVA